MSGFMSVNTRGSGIRIKAVFEGLCAVLTALQRLFASRQDSTGQHPRRSQALERQHVLTLLPEKYKSIWLHLILYVL